MNDPADRIVDLAHKARLSLRHSTTALAPLAALQRLADAVRAAEADVRARLPVDPGYCRPIRPPTPDRPGYLWLDQGHPDAGASPQPREYQDYAEMAQQQDQTL